MVTQATLFFLCTLILCRLRLRQKERKKKESEEKWSNVRQSYMGRGDERG